jgi:TonB family protein
MKTVIIFLFVLILSASVFGQTKALVLTKTAVIKQQPNIKSKTIYTLKKDETISLETTDSTDGWYKVSDLKGNYKGWIKNTAIKLIIANNQWYSVGTLDENYQFYINPYRISKKNGNTLFWLKRSHVKTYDYQLSHQEVNCKENKWRSIEFVSYDRNGDVKKAGSYNETTLKTIIPDSQIEIILEDICGERGEAFGKPPSRLVITGTGSSNQDIIKPPIPKSISGGVLNFKAETLPKAVYPAAARAVRASGAVNVQVRINHDGKVVEAKAISGHPLLQKAAEDAALQSTFKPTLLAGQKVEVTGVIVYNFVP